MANCTPPFSYVDYILTEEMIDPEDRNFTYDFDLLDSDIAPTADQLLVFVNDTQLDADQWEVGPAPGSITIVTVSEGGPLLRVGQRVRIQRDTYRCARYIDWNDNAIINKSDLNLDADQLFYLIQESIDLGYDAMRKDPSGVYWDAKSKRIGKGLPAEQGDDFVTLNQAQDLVNGSGTTQLGNASCWDFEGDGTQTDFELDGPPLTLSPKQLIVSIDGVLQCPCGSEESAFVYTGESELIVINEGSSEGADYATGVESGVLKLTFATPPANNSEICVRLFSGTVSTRLQDMSVDTDQLVDGAVSLAKLELDTSEDVYPRVIIVDQDGACTTRRPVTTDLSDFDAAVEAKSLSDFAAPTADLSMANHRLSNLTSGSAFTDAVNKGQMAAGDSATLAAAYAYTDAELDAASTNKSGVYTSQFVSLLGGVSQTRAFPAYFGGQVPNSIMVQCSQEVTSPATMALTLYNISEWALNTTKTFTPSGSITLTVTRTATGLDAVASGVGAGVNSGLRFRFVLFLNA